jgi:hypothetical protein
MAQSSQWKHLAKHFDYVYVGAQPRGRSKYEEQGDGRARVLSCDVYEDGVEV